MPCSPALSAFLEAAWEERISGAGGSIGFIRGLSLRHMIRPLEIFGKSKIGARQSQDM
jgi:hypothetical protein